MVLRRPLGPLNSDHARRAGSNLLRVRLNHRFQQTQYDLRQRVWKTSNPFRPGGETAQFTSTLYDSLNRVTSVTHPDNSVDLTSYSNNQQTVTDPAQVKRMTQTDAAGRITSVTEYGSPSGTYVTSYGHDALDDLTSVSQPGLANAACAGLSSRCFGYDSLKRLTSAINPESVGRLTSVSSPASKTVFSNYDNLGRPGVSSQATPPTAAAKTFSYQYQPAGLKQITYPSSRVVSYAYDGAGREFSVTSGATSYASQIQYASHGGVQSLFLGNQLYEQTCYNNRLQATGVRLGFTLTDASLCSNANDTLNLQFGFGTNNNNGNVTSQSIYAGGPTYSQTYQYTDGLNR